MGQLKIIEHWFDFSSHNFRALFGPQLNKKLHSDYFRNEHTSYIESSFSYVVWKCYVPPIYFLDTKRYSYSRKTFKRRSHLYTPWKHQRFSDGDVFGMSYVKSTDTFYWGYGLIWETPKITGRWILVSIVILRSTRFRYLFNSIAANCLLFFCWAFFL